MHDRLFAIMYTCHLVSKKGYVSRAKVVIVYIDKLKISLISSGSNNYSHSMYDLKWYNQIMISMLSYYLPLVQKCYRKGCWVYVFLIMKVASISRVTSDHVCTLKWFGGMTSINVYYCMVSQMFSFLKFILCLLLYGVSNVFIP